MIEDPLASCRICGCTDEFPCESGCSWVEPSLCTNCAINRPERPPFLERANPRLVA
ncbi:MAG: hypothetical protein L3J96_01150 [Thermoplasmata archaeon]|nr:hypothetical protein [Thermoplasmata archaeon]